MVHVKIISVRVRTSSAHPGLKRMHESQSTEVSVVDSFRCCFDCFNITKKSINHNPVDFSSQLVDNPCVTVTLPDCHQWQEVTFANDHPEVFMNLSRLLASLHFDRPHQANNDKANCQFLKQVCLLPLMPQERSLPCCQWSIAIHAQWTAEIGEMPGCDLGGSCRNQPVRRVVWGPPLARLGK